MPPKKKGGKKKDDAPSPEPDAGDDVEAPSHFVEPETVVVKPSDQIPNMTSEQLEEETTRVLTANNPNAPKNIVRFSNKEGTYKFEASIEQVSVHFELQGWLLHSESDEAKRILADRAAEEDKIAEFKAAAKQAKEAAGGADPAGDDVQIRNQFNFSERASQTFNNPLRDRKIATDPPPVSPFSATATQWEIFDAFQDDIAKSKAMKEKAGSKDSGKAKKSAESAKDEEDVVHSEDMRKSLKVMERMCNQNTFDDIAQDFKYWEDESDEFKPGEGTLLPLWKFSSEKAKRKHVTAIAWNPEFSDMFAVGYGSYDFMKQGMGVICVFSMKNPGHPEYVLTTETGVMCVDFHPQHSSLVAVGCYDGTVYVFDIRSRVNKPIFQSTVKTGKHTDPVWQISWQEEDLAKNLNFFSISSDGRVTLWTMSKNELTFTDVMELKLVSGPRDESEDDTALVGLAGGMCFDFNRTSEHLFIVGTEEGMIHKCSKAYNSQYLESYEGHYMAVYALKWNFFHSRVFLSASADWTVKLWDHNSKEALMSFDLGNSVGDVAWAPFSSTIFAAVTADGKVHMYDLNVNKHEPLCEQKVVRKAKLTHVVFNPKEPVILVGDDRGNVNALKLSPNLRSRCEISTQAPAAGSGNDSATASGGGRRRRRRKDTSEAKDDDAGAVPQKTASDLEMEKLDLIISAVEKPESS